MNAIYLDYAATCPMDARVLEAMKPMWTCGNPASSHESGHAADDAVTHARKVVAAQIGAQPGEIVFTSGATESDNWAIKGVTAPGIITQATEHKAILQSVDVMRQAGIESLVLPVDGNGLVNLNQLWEFLRPGVLVSIMAVNNETGVMQPVAEIGEICAARGAVFHCDAAQALGRVPIDVDAWGVHLMSFSAHKVYGPKGIGALYIRDGIQIEPMFHGGRQELGRRAGTTNAPLVVGFAEAARLSAQNQDERQRVLGLCRRLIDGVLAGVPEAFVNGIDAPQAPGIVSLSFPQSDQDALLHGLGHRLCCSAGSACSLDGPSHVMKAMGIPHAVLRVSVGRWTTAKNVDQAAGEIADAAYAAQRKTAPMSRPSSWVA